MKNAAFLIFLILITPLLMAQQVDVNIVRLLHTEVQQVKEISGISSSNLTVNSENKLDTFYLNVNNYSSGHDTTKMLTKSASSVSVGAGFAIAAGIGAIKGGVEYGIEWVFTGEPPSGARLAAYLTAGAAEGMAVLAIAFFPQSALIYVCEAYTLPGVTGYFVDLLEGFYESIGSKVSNGWDLLSKSFKDDVNNLSGAMEIKITSTVQALVAQNNATPILSTTLPCWIDFNETIEVHKTSLSYSGMEYNSNYGTWRMTSPGNSYLETSFQLNRVPDKVFTSLLHLTSFSESAIYNGYSPIDVYINGNKIKDNYDVAQSHGDNSWHTDNWAIESYLKIGQNTLKIEFEDDPWAETHYWIRSIYIQEGDIPATTDIYNDITIENQNVSNLSPCPGDEIVLTCDHVYSGTTKDADMDSPNVGFYLSSNKTLGSSDIKLGDDSSSLGSDDPRHDEDETVTIPENTIDGTYYILFVADYLNEISEDDEENNVAYIPISINCGIANDLHIENQSIPKSTLARREEFKVTCDQVYKGRTLNSEMSSPYVGYYISANTTLGSSDILIGEDRSSIGSDETRETETETVSIPSTIQDGNYYILFVADHINEFDEDDEDNNVAYVSVKVDGDAYDDIYIENMNISKATVCQEEQFDVSCEQVYSGTTTDGNLTSPNVGYYLSSNTTYDSSDDILIGEDASSIGSDDIRQLETEPVSIPSSIRDGDYYILFIADYLNEITESDENNNIKYVQITVKCGVLNTPPQKPILISPINGERLSESLIFRWSGADDDDDILTYEILYGISSGDYSGTINSDVESFDSDYEESDEDVTIYWVVRSYDGIDYSELSDEWTFIIPAAATFDVNPNSRSVSSTSGSTSFTVNSNIEWSIEDDASWFSATKTNGNTINVNYNTNTSTSSRSGTLTVKTSDGNKSETVTVTQEGKPADKYLNLTSHTMSLSYLASSFGTFTIKSNVDWTITGRPNWLNLSESSGTGNSTITVTTNSENDSDSDYSTTLTISGGGITKTIAVIQEHKSSYTLEVDNTDLTFTSAKDEFRDFTITSNTSWSISGKPSWINLSANSSSGDRLIHVSTAYANNSASYRFATLTISGDGINRTVEITQSGIIAAKTLIASHDIIVLPSTKYAKETITISSNTNWSVSKLPDWLEATSGSGNNNANITIQTKSANPSTAIRDTIITIKSSDISRTLKVMQEGQPFDDRVPEKTILPNPINNAINQAVSTDLSWINAGGATGYKVYFGTDPNPRLKNGGVYQTNHALNTLAKDTTYYWRVDAVNKAGTTIGDIWSFNTGSGTTHHAPNKPIITYPLNNQEIPMTHSSPEDETFSVEWSCSDLDEDELGYFVSISRTQEGLSAENLQINTDSTINLYFTNPDYDYTGVWYCQVFATDDIDTISSDVVQFVLDWPTSGEDVKLDEQITIYPNPTHQYLNIKFTTKPREYNIGVYNNLGQLIIQKESSNQLERLDLNGNISGLYYLKIYNSEFLKTEKIIVK